MRKLLIALIMLLASLPLHAADKPQYSVVLLQPEQMVAARVPDAKSLADYISGVLQAVDHTVQTTKHGPVGGFIVIAVKPDEKAKVWLDMKPVLDRPTARALTDAAEAAPVLSVSGTVVFALKIGLWGGAEPKTITPAPAEWMQAIHKAGRPMEATQLVESLWPDE